MKSSTQNLVNVVLGIIVFFLVSPLLAAMLFFFLAATGVVDITDDTLNEEANPPAVEQMIEEGEV